MLKNLHFYNFHKLNDIHLNFCIQIILYIYSCGNYNYAGINARIVITSLCFALIQYHVHSPLKRLNDYVAIIISINYAWLQ